MLRRVMRKLHEGDSGFTLIELMIVILVILILAAILVPQFGLARERANKAKCVSNQRNIETAIAMWTTDNPSGNYKGGTMDQSTPSYTNLTGSPQYTTDAAFVEPDLGTHGSTAGNTYYLSNGVSGGALGSAVPTNPSYGHVTCAYQGTADPWVADYNGTGGAGGTAINHARGAAASP